MEWCITVSTIIETNVENFNQTNFCPFLTVCSLDSTKNLHLRAAEVEEEEAELAAQTSWEGAELIRSFSEKL